MQFLSLLRLAQPCCGPFAHILPLYRLSSRHYLRISLSFCQVDGQFSTNLTDHHGHWQKREVCHFFELNSFCGDESQSVTVDNLPPFKPPISLLLSGWPFATSGVRLRRHAAMSRRLGTRRDHDLPQSIAAFLWVLTLRLKFSYSFSFCWIQTSGNCVTLCQFVMSIKSYFVSQWLKSLRFSGSAAMHVPLSICSSDSSHGIPGHASFLHQGRWPQ